MKTKSTIQQLVEFKKNTGMKWRIISSEIGVDKYTLSRWVNGVHKPIAAHEKVIKKFLKNNC